MRTIAQIKDENYDILKVRNELTRNGAKFSGVPVGRIEKVDFDKDLCAVKIQGQLYKKDILTVYASIFRGQTCVSNISALKGWKGFEKGYDLIK